MAAKQYQVTAALATVKTTDGHLRYVYQDGFLPADADADSVKHLLAMGLIGEVKDVAKAAASADPEPGNVANKAS